MINFKFYNVLVDYNVGLETLLRQDIFFYKSQYPSDLVF